jgi:4a-hydroxytetrahydrobiopterin dehydratase
MALPAKLSATEINDRLGRMLGWSLRGDALHRELSFTDFASAWAFMSRVALAAERLGHHPDWRNSWNRVTIDLSTHDVGGITALDFELAAAIDAAARGVS